MFTLENTNNVASSLNCSCSFVSSNFRVFLNRDLLNSAVKLMGERDWWLSIQHGWGLLSFLVPIFKTNATINGYIAASDHFEDLCRIGSRPDIDEAFMSSLHGGGLLTIKHDGSDLRRLDKLQYIHSLISQEISVPAVRVCLRSFAGGRNCCMCEKCARTIASILAIGCAQPKMFGFDDYEKFGANWNQTFIRNTKKNRYYFGTDWLLIQKSIKDRNWYLDQGLSEYQIQFLEWVKNLDFNKINKAKLSKRRTPEWLKRMFPSSKVIVPTKLRVLWNRLKDHYF